MISLQLYDHLQQFPLFQGLSRSELLQMAGNTKFGFEKLPANSVVVREGDACQRLLFLIGGQLSMETVSDDHSYTVSEQLSAPWLLQPEVLFGTITRYTCTVRTVTPCSFFTLSKDEVMRLLDDFLIIRLNLVNHYAALVQRRSRQAWRRQPLSLEGRIVRFLLDHAIYPAGPKQVHIRMQRLADELNDTRLNISRTLNAMQQRGLLRLRRGIIEVPSLELLLM